MPVLGEPKGGWRGKDRGLVLCWSVRARCSGLAHVVPSIQHQGKKRQETEKRRQEQDLVGRNRTAPKKDGERCFTRACSDRTRGTGFKLTEGRFRSNLKNVLGLELDDL